jgi:ectoine hydroxylase-related dioxygenase (phytanoyl-CoA dioxygenase family)
MSYGQVLQFDGANLMHGNRLNDTFQTRVSFDFRVVDIEKFKPSGKGSINMNSKFDIGGYFKKM